MLELLHMHITRIHICINVLKEPFFYGPVCITKQNLTWKS